jgi:hypothetical protein
MSEHSNEFVGDPEIIAQLCQEYWKLASATEKAAELLPEREAKRLSGQLNFSKRQLDVLMKQIGLRLVDFTGEPFHAGLSVSVDNSGDYGEDEALFIDRTLEPTVMSDMTVISLGRVIVAPVKQEEE